MLSSMCPSFLSLVFLSSCLAFDCSFLGEESTFLSVWKPPELNLIPKICQVMTKLIYADNLRYQTFWMKKPTSCKLVH